MSTSSGSNNERWEPNKLVPFDLNNPANTLIGYYKDSREINGRKGPFSVHEIVTVGQDGKLAKVFDVSLGKVLEDCLDKIPLNTFVCIRYTGKARSKSTGNDFNTVEVFQDSNAVPLDQRPDYAAFIHSLNEKPKEQAKPSAPVFAKPVSQGPPAGFNATPPAHQAGSGTFVPPTPANGGAAPFSPSTFPSFPDQGSNQPPY